MPLQVINYVFHTLTAVFIFGRKLWVLYSAPGRESCLNLLFEVFVANVFSGSFKDGIIIIIMIYLFNKEWY